VLGLRLALKFRASVRGRLGFRVRLRLGSGSEADVRNGDFQEEGDARGGILHSAPAVRCPAGAFSLEINVRFPVV